MINFFCFFVLKISLQNIHNLLNIFSGFKQNESSNNICCILILLLILNILLYLYQHLIILNLYSMTSELKQTDHALIIKSKVNPQNTYIWKIKFIFNVLFKKDSSWLRLDVIDVSINVDIQFIFEHFFKF
jgi:hypothetical protein